MTDNIDMEQAAFSKNLTIAGGSGYGSRVVGIPATGFESPCSRRTTAAYTTGGFFVSVQYGLLSFGWAVRGAFGLAGSLTRSLNLHGSAHFAFESAVGGDLQPSVKEYSYE